MECTILKSNSKHMPIMYKILPSFSGYVSDYHRDFSAGQKIKKGLNNITLNVCKIVSYKPPLYPHKHFSYHEAYIQKYISEALKSPLP